MRLTTSRRARVARQHAEALSVHLEALGYRGEAAAARTIIEILDGQWSAL